MVSKKTWQEFRETGLLWFINTTLHVFGWAICVNVDENGIATEAFPARVKFRGFDEERNTEGYVKITEYLAKEYQELLKEAKE
jgi:hypothetical protein